MIGKSRLFQLCLCVDLLFGASTAQQTPADTPTFTTKVNLVTVPVVVRDRLGDAVGTLHQEDFRLFDKGKPQLISKFSVEKRGGSQINIAPDGSSSNSATRPPLPERFVAYLFDDVNLTFGNLVQSRDAAERHLATSLAATDRAAIYSTSGQTMLDFTDDREKLRETLRRLRPMSRAPSSNECPSVSYYMADQIQNRNDSIALSALIAEVIACASLDRRQRSQAEQLARGAVSRSLSIGETETRQALSVLKAVVRKLSVMPGQRSLVLVSPGFILSQYRPDESDILDRAIHSHVMINSLDARGLYVDSEFDASQRSWDRSASIVKATYAHQAAEAQADVMAELADGTGGTFFHNNNDLNEGFGRVAAAPEYVYTLGFSPQNLKLDGSFHVLKVTLANSNGMSLLARRGYFAPKHAADPKEEAKHDIEDAVYSREELHDIPIELRTQVSRSGEAASKLTVISRVDLRPLRYRKVDGRNWDDLTVVSALFDRNGNFITGITKNLELRLTDETVKTKLDLPMAVTATFDVKPGSYVMRVVARDSEGQMMAARNGTVEIP